MALTQALRSGVPPNIPLTIYEPTTSSDLIIGDQRTLNDICVKEFHDILAKSCDVATAVAAIKALTSVIRNSSAQTIMGLSKELEGAAAALQK